jgi:hypothetical protein
MRGVLMSLVFWAGSAIAATGQLVPISSERTFAPQGFDDNDQIQVVIEGKLDNDCYRLGTPNVRIDDVSHQVLIQPRAAYFQWLCLEVQVPWTQVVPIGPLAAGAWTIHVGSSGESATMAVKSASALSPDDHVYAPVEALFVDVHDGLATATIRGHFTTRCADFEDIRVIDSGKTIEVLPIMTAGSARSCERSDTPFERQITLPQKSAGRYLVHVRSLNGAALNQVYEIK